MPGVAERHQEPRPEGSPDASPAVEPRERGESTLTLVRAAETTNPAERIRLQNEVAERHLGMAKSIALRFGGRGIATDDLIQAASMALLKATRNFDPHRGVEFLSYASVTITGEVRRHFRDFGWVVRPPRPIQKLQTDLNRAESELSHILGRPPRISELAAHLDVPLEAAIEAAAARGCFSPSSLDVPMVGSGTVGDLIAAEGDPDLAAAEARRILAPVLRTLGEQERHVLFLRFFEQRSQADIAAATGESQMQISRILARTLRQLRTQLG